MRKITLTILLLGCLVVTRGQDSTSFGSTVEALYACGLIPDSLQKAQQLEKLWARLQSNQQIPLIQGDSVAFLFRGTAQSVDWMGDFNGWGYDRKFNNKGKLIPGTGIWILKCSFPKDARLDYKLVLDGRTWILDPENTHQQWSGVGGGSPNSELRMPAWKEDPVLQPRVDIPHGTLKEEILFDSKTLGYQITYSVYLPPDYKKLGDLPSLYVTDGYEYMLPKLGNMVTVTDNLLADKKIKPLIIIFVDHREPINRANNKRMEELAMNPKYLDFFATEFIPFIETHYPVLKESSTRGIMGTSMGGLAAAYFAFTKPGVFGLAGIQSPAFSVRPQIFLVCNSPNHPMKVSMTSGLISDASDGSRKMRQIMETNACEYHYKEVNDGHSWGNWRNLIDDILIDLYGR